MLEFWSVKRKRGIKVLALRQINTKVLVTLHKKDIKQVRSNCESKNINTNRVRLALSVSLYAQVQERL
jgi:hypothetical protein